jgi:SHS2 domain-containing protein
MKKWLKFQVFYSISQNTTQLVAAMNGRNRRFQRVKPAWNILANPYPEGQNPEFPAACSGNKGFEGLPLSVILEMSMESKESGYREIEHTADWELEVWAPDLTSLFIQAARGMYALSGVVLQPGPRLTRALKLEAFDSESLLVSFLSELVFLGEMEDLGFDEYDLSLDGSSLVARVSGACIKDRKKEIKAVTYHNLEITSGPRGLEVRIVFDV